MDFKILSDKEHILKRPGMYIGSTTPEQRTTYVLGNYKSVTYVQGLVKIVNEIIDNSVDEAIRTKYKHANRISVDINQSSVSVEDNGRGLPQDLIEYNGDMIPKAVAAWTLTKAGTNFDDSDRTTIGMNGVGSALTNYFSTKFVGITGNGTSKLTLTCMNNADGITHKSIDSDYKGTQVEFIPDFDYFSTGEIDEQTIEMIHDRIVNLAISFPKIRFKFNGKTIRYTFPKYAGLFSEYNWTHHSSKISFFLFPVEGGVNEHQKSFVNGVETIKGGTHIDTIVESICGDLIPLIKRKHKLDIKPMHIKSNLGMVCFVKDFNNPKFDSQTKERFSSSKADFNAHADLDYKALAKKLVDCDEIIQPIIEAEEAKRLANERREETKAAKKAAKAKVAKHVKAGGHKDTTLFLLEGDSAIGYLTQVRDSARHGGYPLRGKVTNTYGLSLAKMLKNQEMFELCGILGLESFETDEITYDRIAIMVDADVDGGDILCGLINFFSKWPWLFEQGRITYCKTPIVIASKGDKERWFYTEAEFEAAKLTGYNIRYIKGLGSLEEDEYRKIINDPVLETIRLGDNYEEMLRIVYQKGAEDERKVWMQQSNKTVEVI